MAKTLLATKLLPFHKSAAATTLAHNTAALLVVVRRPDAAIPILTDTSLAVVAADDTDNLLLLLLLLLLHCFPTVPSSLLLSISLVPASSSPLSNSQKTRVSSSSSSLRSPLPKKLWSSLHATPQAFLSVSFPFLLYAKLIGPFLIQHRSKSRSSETAVSVQVLRN
jgi:hypothetical protein